MRFIINRHLFYKIIKGIKINSIPKSRLILENYSLNLKPHEGGAHSQISPPPLVLIVLLAGAYPKGGSGIEACGAPALEN